MEDLNNKIKDVVYYDLYRRAFQALISASWNDPKTGEKAAELTDLAVAELKKREIIE